MRALQMKVYEKSPIYFQNILTSLDGYRKIKERYQKTYFTFLNFLEKSDSNDLESEVSYQEQEMKKLVRHAAANSPFYQEFYAGINLNEIQTLEDLKKLPVLEKEMVRQNIASMYTIPEAKALVSHTSGTSGTPMKFLYTKDDIQKRMAFLDFFKKQHGVINLEMKRASFSCNRFVPRKQKAKVFWRDNVFLKQRLYSTYECQEQNAAVFVKNLDVYKPEFIDGLPSALYEVAKYINDNEITLSFTPTAIFPTAETLYPHYRKEIEKAFNSPVRDQYASSEGSPFITECIHGRLHYNMKSGIIETTEDGEMVVTCFNTYGTPLIRYKIGDHAEFDMETTNCECGSSHPIVKEIYGRTNDYLVSKKKEKFTAFYLAIQSEKFSTSIRKMQFIQNNLEQIEVLIEKAENYTDEMTGIVRSEMEYLFGNDMKFNIHVLDCIPPQPNGKYRLVVNNLPEEARL
ncbi:phenylacetate--CoA ligase family protein [Planococcus sp. YIM B11945]|uniref:phenylacetate--CoA ligase family protein n=1 Tax=Planococcus sp. YIM B11945 TaxID=3435410 RepID=UPI003D7DF11D